MGFEGEFASYEPFRRLRDSEKVKAFETLIVPYKPTETFDEFKKELVSKEDIDQSSQKPDLILAFDGGELIGPIEKGFPGSELGYVTLATVLIDLKRISQLEKKDFVSPKEFRETEKVEAKEAVFPGCNVVYNGSKDAKSSLRRRLFEEFGDLKISLGDETLLETYEYLFKIKRQGSEEKNLPLSPIEGVDEKMTYDYGQYTCKHSGEPLFSTDALRLHELMNPAGSNGEMFGQIRSTIEKLWLIHTLRAFESKKWLSTLKRVAFVVDGPLAVFSTSSWLTKPILFELSRINELQKKINGQDMLIIGIEKSGTFLNHLIDLDTKVDGTSDLFPKQSAFLLGDEYIKKSIRFSDSDKPYGLDTYFGRKIFYKTLSGQLIVPNIAHFRDFGTYDDNKTFLKSTKISCFPRLGDIMDLLDQLVSSRYPNSVSPLVSAHAEAAIPLNLGKRIFEDIAREIREKSKE
jgi:hypothetical protein